MTSKETMDIIRSSSLWGTLSIREKVEAISYAIEHSGPPVDPYRDEAADISDLIWKGPGFR